MTVTAFKISLLTPLIQWIVSKVIEAGTNGDAGKQYARAQELLAVNAAAILIDNGDPTGPAALAAALTNQTALSPGEAVALQSLLATFGNQLTLLNQAGGGTLLGGAAQLIVTQILTAANAVASAYPAPAAAK